MERYYCPRLFKKKYENMDPYGNGLMLREITGKELQLQKIMDSK
jgi:hypothetical protein